MFQGDAFQGNAFQVGSPLLYPWAPATGAAYTEGLPDRTRVVFYQGLAGAPSPPTAATTTPTTAGLQDVDKAFVRPFRAVGFQFSTFTQNDQRTATPITAGIQDFDRFMVRRPRPLQEVGQSYPAAFFGETEGFDDFDQMIVRRPRMPPQDVTSITISGVRASTPFTAGLQDFDRLSRVIQRLLGEVTFTQFTPFFGESEGFDDFDIFQRRPPRLPLGEVTSTQLTTTATQTPTTAGVVPDFPALLRRPFVDLSLATLAINTTVAAQTPITAGLQDLDYRFKAPFRPPQFSDFIVHDTRAGTPTTAGIQDFDAVAFRRPRAQDFMAALAGQARVITAGIQDFDRVAFLRRLADAGQSAVLAPARAATAGAQDLDQPLRRRRPLLDQGVGLVFAPTATATPITAGLQDLDYRFVRPFRPALQQVTSTAPASIVLALTPAPFQFAVAGLPPFRYGMHAHLQMFSALMLEKVVARFIIQRPSPGALLTPTSLLGTKDAPGLSGTKDETDLSGEVEG